jgi:hypothetical protein
MRLTHVFWLEDATIDKNSVHVRYAIHQVRVGVAVPHIAPHNQPVIRCI